MRAIRAIVLIIILELVLVGICYLGVNYLSSDDGVSFPPAITNEEMPTNSVSSPPTPQVANAIDTSYKLVVGANVVVNTNQKLSPPNGSVVITGGEQQLRELREQAKKAQ